MISRATAAMDAFHRSLPDAPFHDFKQIQGNLPAEEKRLNANILGFFLTGRGGPSKVTEPFGFAIGEKLKIVEMNVWERAGGGDVDSQLVVEVEITADMCNVFGAMNGACYAYLLDSLTISSMVMLGRIKGFDGTGLSQSMNIYWHHAALLGETIRVTTRSVFAGNRERLASCEIREKASGRLVSTGTHSFLHAGRATKL
ncbi:hypothetical protein GGX14DRAFT_483687 [Mycena pura]|uniref:Thioesterase domain-containing protein n=1 Tax=Mycena pura TaxID=153505 RepID=A0AAD6XW77_9AGAR|nr:hypothetical protein GGX14DRAFT_483687 [Mycena pura]